jgi:hypothetical protein
MGIIRKRKLSPSIGVITIGETGLVRLILTSSTSTVLRQSERYVLLKPISRRLPSIAAGILSEAEPKEVALETLIRFHQKCSEQGF